MGYVYSSIQVSVVFQAAFRTSFLMGTSPKISRFRKYLKLSPTSHPPPLAYPHAYAWGLASNKKIKTYQVNPYQSVGYGIEGRLEENEPIKNILRTSPLSVWF